MVREEAHKIEQFRNPLGDFAGGQFGVDAQWLRNQVSDPAPWVERSRRSWNTICKRRLNGLSSASDLPVMSSPSNSSLPSVMS